MTDEEEDGTGEEEKGRNWSDCAGREEGPLLLLLRSSKERKEKGCHACLLWRKIFSHSGGDRRRRRRFLPLSRSFFLPLLLLPVIVATFGNAGKWRDWQREKEEERVSIVDDWCGIRRLNAERTRFLLGVRILHVIGITTYKCSRRRIKLEILAKVG